jgi:hypothetical protein
MAKTINLKFDGEEMSFSYRPIDRSVLYGRRKRVPIDDSGQDCQKASLLSDGSLLIKSGMTAQGYFTSDGNWVPQSELESMLPDGTVPQLQPSTIGVTVDASAISANDVLGMRFTNNYLLDPEHLPDNAKKKLDDGLILSFPFNPRSDYEASLAVLVSNENGYFALIAEPCSYEFLSLTSTVDISDEADSEITDDLDFEMF